MAAPKRIDFRKSYSARSAFVIGRKNDTFFLEKVLNHIFKPKELPGFNRRAILNLEKERISINEKKDRVEQNRKNLYRQALRTREGPHKPGDYIEDFDDDYETF